MGRAETMKINFKQPKELTPQLGRTILNMHLTTFFFAQAIWILRNTVSNLKDNHFKQKQKIKKRGDSAPGFGV